VVPAGPGATSGRPASTSRQAAASVTNVSGDSVPISANNRARSASSVNTVAKSNGAKAPDRW
jgi:hypothetical protein